MDVTRYAELFLTESQDNLSAINHALLELERSPTAREPVGALFRHERQWAVFTAKQGRARLTRVQVDHSDGRETEVPRGLTEGDLVLVHPSDKITDGVRIVMRPDRTRGRANADE